MDYNNGGLIGRLTADAIIKVLPTGTQCIEFSIANNTGYGDSAKANFFDVTFWAKNCETMKPMLKKGKQVAINYTLVQDRWTDKATGQNRSKVKLNVYSTGLQLLSDPSGGTPYTTDEGKSSEDPMPVF